MGVTLEGRTKSYWKVLGSPSMNWKGGFEQGVPGAGCLLAEHCAEDTATLTGTWNKLCESENERHNCTLFICSMSSYGTSWSDLMQLCLSDCCVIVKPIQYLARELASGHKINSSYWVMSCHLDGWVQQKIHIYTVKASTVHVLIIICILSYPLLGRHKQFPIQVRLGLEILGLDIFG